MGVLQILSLSTQYYSGFYPHSHGHTAVIVSIATLLPPSPSPCHSLLGNPWLVLFMAVGSPRTQRRSADSVHKNWMPWMRYIGRWSSILMFQRYIQNTPLTTNLLLWTSGPGSVAVAIQLRFVICLVIKDPEHPFSYLLPKPTSSIIIAIIVFVIRIVNIA